MNISDPILIAFAILFPAVVLEVVKRNKLAGMIGPVVLCYAIGLLLGNIPSLTLNGELSMTISEAVIPLAIALLLFSTDFMRWLKHARTSMFSFFLGALGVVASSFFISWLFLDKVPEVWKLAGMMIGVYTGGTPNMSAIGLALDVKEEVFILLNACDVVLSGIYLLLLMTVAQKLALKFLPSFKRVEETDRESTFHYQQTGYDTDELVKKIEKRKEAKQKAKFKVATLRKLVIVRSMALGFLLAAFVLGASIGFSILVTGKITAPHTLLAVTSLSIGASFFKKVRRLPRTYELGEYFLLIFCLSIGMVSNFAELLNSSPEVFLFCAAVFVSSISLHFLLAFIFRIDADTVLITSTAGIFGPAFIGPVASVLKNKDIVVSGLTTGLVGYAVANFVGLGVAYLFQSIFF